MIDLFHFMAAPMRDKVQSEHCSLLAHNFLSGASGRFGFSEGKDRNNMKLTFKSSILLGTAGLFVTMSGLAIAQRFVRR